MNIPIGFCQCGCGRKTKIKHFPVAERGEPLLYVKHHAGRPTYTIEEAFWKRVNKNGVIMREGLTPCWIWLGSSGGGGHFKYPQFAYGKKCRRVSRFVWELFNQKIIPSPKDMVCHVCDNNACINPDHLYLGNHTSNMADMKTRKRAVFGERHHNAVITCDKAKEIKLAFANGERSCNIARNLRVSIDIVRHIKYGKVWNHVEID